MRIVLPLICLDHPSACYLCCFLLYLLVFVCYVCVIVSFVAYCVRVSLCVLLCMKTNTYNNKKMEKSRVFIKVLKFGKRLCNA